MRPYLQSHSGDVELLGIDEGVARLRLQGSCDGCPSSASTLELAIEQALEEAAPDLAGIEVEGVVEATVFHGRQLPLAAAPASAPGWTALDGLDGLAPDTMNAALVDGVKLVVANVGGTLLAYRERVRRLRRVPRSRRPRVRHPRPVPAAGGASSCPSRDGCSAARSRSSSTPVPLLAENGGVKVAVAA